MNIPITKPYFDEEEYRNVQETMKSGWVAQGPQVSNFERKVAAHEKAGYAVAVSSCTTALHLALLSMGIGKGDDVIAPSFTFIATANAIEYTGANAVLADIELDTFNISVDSIQRIIDLNYVWNSKKEHLCNKVTGNLLKAIVPVHQFGLCAEMEKINVIAHEFNLVVIEDAACALGAKRNHIHQGGFGNISCVSFHPRKCITTGEGGMIFTEDERIYNELKGLRSHGATVSEVNRHANHGYLLPDYPVLGYNYRMSDVQAAIGCAQIEKLDYILAERRKAAKIYDEMLQKIGWLNTPTAPQENFHTYQSYVCLMNEDEPIETLREKRDGIMNYLENHGIQTRQGTHAVHTLGYYQEKYGYQKLDLPNAYKAHSLSIAIPLFVGITIEEQTEVVKTIQEAYQKGFK